MIINKDINVTSIEKEMKQSYLEYAMSVIIGRALPDVRDGLKPVHRRSLYAMQQARNDWNKSYKNLPVLLVMLWVNITPMVMQQSMTPLSGWLRIFL